MNINHLNCSADGQRARAASMRISDWLVLVLLTAAGACHADAPDGTDEQAVGSPASADAGEGLALPPHLRAVLIKEMLGLRQGVAELAASLSAGEWDNTQRTAVAIRDSYIMRQALTESELHELEAILPADFAELDERLHEHADALARAVAHRDSELSVFYYGKILDGCQSCHRRYATKTLPGFAEPESSRADAHSP
jgi:hypothetical protein